MNKNYIIWPIVMIVAFMAYVWHFNKGYKIRSAEKEAAIERELAEREAERKRLQEIAAKENLERAAAKAKEEADKLAERRRKQEEKDQSVRDEIAERQKDVDAMAKEKGLLEAKLAETRRARVQSEADAFDAARAVELAKIDRRTAELEIQRAAGFIAAKVEGSSLVEIPVFPKEPARK